MEDRKHRLSELLKKDSWTSDEKKWLLNYLQGSENNELQELMWQEFKQDNVHNVSPSLSKQMLEELHAQLQLEQEKEETPVIKLWIKRLAVAASVIAVIALSYLFFTDKPVNQSVVKNDVEKAVPAASVRRVVNNTGKDKKIELGDGSEVVLSDGSEIAYNEPFKSDRQINLSGKAYFKVAKDKTSPFTVVTGNVSTTALGTAFTITTYRNYHRLIVRLYEGRVVIRSQKDESSLPDSVFLKPGQQFTYNKGSKYSTGWFKLQNESKSEKVLKREYSYDNPSIPEDGGSWYMFNNQSLVQVFEQLGEMYNAEIIYNSKEIENLYFIGKFNAQDSLEHILSQIGRLNNLSIEKKNNKFIISK